VSVWSNEIGIECGVLQLHVLVLEGHVGC
jgi:hypothetical protein